MNNKEMLEVLNSMVIVVDGREKRNEHITEYFDKQGIPYRYENLISGDYAFECSLPNYNLCVCVERKNSWDEISQNFTKNRERFINEFERAKDGNVKMHMVIENASFKKLFAENYRSKTNSNSFFASLMTWCVRYNIPIWFSGKEECGKVIHGILYYELRERLKNI